MQILPVTGTIAIDEINQAFERMERGGVRYRFVIDMGSLALVRRTHAPVPGGG